MEEDDDIDDLLNELEEKFKSTAFKDVERRDPVVSKVSIIDELDDLLAETDDIKVFDDNLNKKKVTSKNRSSSQVQETTKCFPIYLAGSHFLWGLNNNSQKRSCDKLRCTSCDFKVLSFEDYAWLSSVDYLFLRNNVPDFRRLSARLTSKKENLEVSISDILDSLEIEFDDEK